MNWIMGQMKESKRQSDAENAAARYSIAADRFSSKSTADDLKRIVDAANDLHSNLKGLGAKWPLYRSYVMSLEKAAKRIIARGGARPKKDNSTKHQEAVDLETDSTAEFADCADASHDGRNSLA